MNTICFDHSPDYEYPGTKLDMKTFMDHLSVEYIANKSKGRDHDVGTNPRISDCKTEDCTDLGEISSISRVGQEQDEKVNKFSIEFVVFYRERL